MSHIEVFHGESVSDEGEQYVRHRIERWLEDTGQDGIIFVNVVVPQQLDLVVFTQQTCVVVEVKAWHARVTGERNGYWSHARGAVTRKLRNGYRQTLEQNQALRDAFRRHFGKEAAYPHGILVFRHRLEPGSNVHECSDFKVRVCEMDDFEATLARAPAKGWALDDVRVLAGALNLSRKPPVVWTVSNPDDAVRRDGIVAHAPRPPAPRQDTRPDVGGLSRYVPEQPLTPVRTVTRRRGRRLAPIGILGIALAVAGAVGLSHKSAKTAADLHGAPRPGAVTQASAESAARSGSGHGSRHHAATRHDRPHGAPPPSRPVPSEEADPVALPLPARPASEMRAAAPPPVCPPGVDRLGCPQVLIDPAGMKTHSSSAW